MFSHSKPSRQLNFQFNYHFRPGFCINLASFLVYFGSLFGYIPGTLWGNFWRRCRHRFWLENTRKYYISGHLGAPQRGTFRSSFGTHFGPLWGTNLWVLLAAGGLPAADGRSTAFAVISRFELSRQLNFQFNYRRPPRARRFPRQDHVDF